MGGDHGRPAGELGPDCPGPTSGPEGCFGDSVLLQLNANTSLRCAQGLSSTSSEAGLVQFNPNLLIEEKIFFAVAIFTLAPAVTNA